jgi:hypothetical protein
MQEKPRSASGGTALTIVGAFLATFKEYPPSQRPSSFSIDQMVEQLQWSFNTAK